jgi:hypothetical protein
VNKKECFEQDRRAKENVWKKTHNFHEIQKCCRLCSHQRSATLPPFSVCQLSKKELGKSILIIDSNYVCDEYDLADVVLEERVAKQKIISREYDAEKIGIK